MDAAELQYILHTTFKALYIMHAIHMVKYKVNVVLMFFFFFLYILTHENIFSLWFVL